jgi:hypothetical protein
MEIKYKKDMQQLKFYRTLNNYAAQQKSAAEHLRNMRVQNMYSEKFIQRDKNKVFMTRKVSIPLSAEIQAQAEEITKDFNHVFQS